MSPQASLAQAEAARRTQERKHQAEREVTAKLDRMIEENDLAAAFREAFSGGGSRG